MRDVHFQFAGSRAGGHLEIDLIEADEAGRESGEDDGGRLRAHSDGRLTVDTSATVGHGVRRRKATLGLVAPMPTRYMIRYSPGLAGLELETSEKSAECCAMICAPFWTLGWWGHHQRTNARRGGNDIEHLRQRQRVIDAEDDGKLLRGRGFVGDLEVDLAAAQEIERSLDGPDQREGVVELRWAAEARR